MSRRKFLDLCAHLAVHARRPVLLAGLLLTLVAAVVASHLGLNFQWTEMLPADSPLVRGIERAHRDFVTGNAYIAVVESTDPEKLEDAVDDVAAAFAAVDVLTIRQVIQGVPEEYALDHGLGTIDRAALEQAQGLLADPALTPFLRHLNDLFEADYTNDSARMDEDERSVVATLQAVGTLVDALQRTVDGAFSERTLARAIRDLTTGDPYLRSLDGRMALVMVAPDGDPAELNSVIPLDLEADRIFREMAVAHPGVTFRRTGVIPISRDEIDSLGGLTYLLSAVAAIAAYLLLAVSFRDLSTPLLASLPLAAGIIWALAFYTLTVHALNIITAVIMMVLTGLGIDFSIHLIGRYQEERAAGLAPEPAIRRTLRETGEGVITGGLTTALAFFALMVARTKGIWEFGFCAGSGMILTLGAVLLLLPALLVWRDQRLAATGGALASRPLPLLGGAAAHVARWPRAYALLVLLTALAGIWLGSGNRYEYNLLELEPRGLSSVELQSEIVDRFGLSVEVAYATARDVADSRAQAEALLDLDPVGDVDDISRWLPAPQDTLRRGPMIAEIRATARARAAAARPFDAADPAARRALAEEIGRLRDNVIELGDLAYVSGLDRIATAAAGLTGAETPDGPLVRLASQLQAALPEADANAVAPLWRRVAGFADQFGASLAARIERMTRLARPTRFSDLPEDVVARYRSAESGEFLVTVMPKGNIYEREPLVRFTTAVGSVSGTVVGTPHLILAMNEEMLREGKMAIPAAFLAIALLLFLDFRRLRLTLLAMVPLVVASAWLLGVMRIFGIAYNFVNVIAIPILIGVGVDDGVHLLHRLRHSSSLRQAGSSVGRAMLLTSLTTMVGFGSIGFYSHRGMASLGIALTIGVGACFLATLVALPPLLRIFGLLPSPTSGDPEERS